MVLLRLTIKYGRWQYLCQLELTNIVNVNVFVYVLSKFFNENIHYNFVSFQELAKPKAEQPDIGFLVSNVELLPLCSSKFRPGPPSDHAQVISNIVSDIVTNSKCIDLKDLCIVPDKLAWVVYCDMACLDYDGSIVDACIITIMSSLKTCMYPVNMINIIKVNCLLFIFVCFLYLLVLFVNKNFIYFIGFFPVSLPSVTFDTETEEIKVDTSVRLPLKVHGLPVATSFAVYQQLPRYYIFDNYCNYTNQTW